MDPYAGADIGAYRLDEKVGEGAYGAVWAGTHRENGSRAAFKMLLPTAAASAEHVSRFHREADLLARVKSRNVAEMIDFVVDPRFGVVLVMELIIGERLSDVLTTPLPLPETIDLGIQLLSGTRDLHAQGIIHRDLKPHNIMLCDEEVDGSRRVVIVDLGLGRLVRSAKVRTPAQPSLTPSFVVLGTLPCIAPEQIVNARDVTERADLYAIGSILHRALTGHYPFEASDTKSLAQEKLTAEAPPFLQDETDHVAIGLRDIVTKAIRRRPTDRYESADAMMAALRVLSAELAGARSSEPAAEPHRGAEPVPAASSPAMGWAVGLLVMASAAFAWWALRR